jgi:hypothetical protein
MHVCALGNVIGQTCHEYAAGAVHHVRIANFSYGSRSVPIADQCITDTSGTHARLQRERKMKIPSDLDELTALFEKLGAREPGSWARSQLSEGINQLQRFLFLRQAWSLILREDDTDWIHGEIARAQRRPDGPYAGVGHALRRCVEKRRVGSRPDGHSTGETGRAPPLFLLLIGRPVIH